MKQFNEMTDAEKIESMRAGFVWLGQVMQEFARSQIQFAEANARLSSKMVAMFDDLSQSFGGPPAREILREHDERMARTKAMWQSIARDMSTTEEIKAGDPLYWNGVKATTKKADADQECPSCGCIHGQHLVDCAAIRSRRAEASPAQVDLRTAKDYKIPKHGVRLQVLSCSVCGKANSPDSTQCEHCRSTLAGQQEGRTHDRSIVAVLASKLAHALTPGTPSKLCPNCSIANMPDVTECPTCGEPLPTIVER